MERLVNLALRRSVNSANKALVTGRRTPLRLFAAGLFLFLGLAFVGPEIAEAAVQHGCRDIGTHLECTAQVGPNDPGIYRITVKRSDNNRIEDIINLQDCPTSHTYFVHKAPHGHKHDVQLCANGTRQFVYIENEAGQTSPWPGDVCSTMFNDVAQPDTFFPYVRSLACQNILSGYDCGGIGEPCPGHYFRPSARVTRGQIAKMIANSAGFAEQIPPDQQTFADVPTTSTFWPYIERAYSHGLIGGYPCGGPGEPCDAANRPYFRVGNEVTRGQLSKMAALAGGIRGTPERQTFADVPIGSPFHSYVEHVAGWGVIGGYPCGGPGEPCDAANRPYFRLGNSSTRGQAAKIIAITFFPNQNPPFFRTVNGDNDPNDQETIAEDPTLDPARSQGTDEDNDGDIDTILVGTRGGGSVSGTGNVDGDEDTEVIVADPTINPARSHGIDIDNDGDFDTIFVGTSDGATVWGNDNVDNDPNDAEVIVEDPTLPPQESQSLDLDGDGDFDLIFIGTGAGASATGSANTDGDEDTEILVDDPTLPRGRTQSVDLDNDGDTDVIIIGTMGAGPAPGTNTDKDADGAEVSVDWRHGKSTQSSTLG